MPKHWSKRLQQTQKVKMFECWLCICAETVDLSTYVKKLLHPVNLTKRLQFRNVIFHNSHLVKTSFIIACQDPYLHPAHESCSSFGSLKGVAPSHGYQCYNASCNNSWMRSKTQTHRWWTSHIPQILFLSQPHASYFKRQPQVSEMKTWKMRIIWNLMFSQQWILKMVVFWDVTVYFCSLTFAVW